MNTHNQPAANNQHEDDPHPVPSFVHELHLISDEQCTVRVCAPHTALEPTGEDILSLAGRPATPEQIVLQLLHSGGFR